MRIISLIYRCTLIYPLRLLYLTFYAEQSTRKKSSHLSSSLAHTGRLLPIPECFRAFRLLLWSQTLAIISLRIVAVVHITDRRRTWQSILCNRTGFHLMLLSRLNVLLWHDNTERDISCPLHTLHRQCYSRHCYHERIIVTARTSIAWIASIRRRAYYESILLSPDLAHIQQTRPLFRWKQCRTRQYHPLRQHWENHSATGNSRTLVERSQLASHAAGSR
jgi:hypothetical protein